MINILVMDPNPTAHFPGYDFLPKLQDSIDTYFGYEETSVILLSQMIEKELEGKVFNYNFDFFIFCDYWGDWYKKYNRSMFADYIYAHNSKIPTFIKYIPEKHIFTRMAQPKEKAKRNSDQIKIIFGPKQSGKTETLLSEAKAYSDRALIVCPDKKQADYILDRTNGINQVITWYEFVHAHYDPNSFDAVFVDNLDVCLNLKDKKVKYITVGTKEDEDELWV